MSAESRPYLQELIKINGNLTFLENLYYNNLVNDFEKSENEKTPNQSQYIAVCREKRLLIKEILSIESQQSKLKTDTQFNPENTFPRSWINSINQFAREALNVTLHPHQLELCESTARTNILIAGRGAGKSLAAQVKAIHKAVTCPKHTVLVVSSGQRMSSDFGSKLLDLIRESIVSQWVKTISEEKVTFHNGSTIHLLPANSDTIRGYHPKRSQTNHSEPNHSEPNHCESINNHIKSGITAILDEACFMDQGSEIRKAIEYTLITTDSDDGKLYIVSSPTTSGSWVHEYITMAENPEANVRVFHCASSTNPAVSEEEIERLRATKNEMEFRAEVLGEWVDGAYGLFAGLIEPNRVNEDQLPSDAVTALGADLALSFQATHDRNVLAVAAKWYPENSGDELEARYRLLEVIPLEHSSDRELKSHVRRMREKYNIALATVEQFQGKSLAEYCQEQGIDTELIAATAGQQRMIFHEIHRLLRQNLLELPNTLPDLFFEELNNFEYRMEKNGSVSFGHLTSSQAHDDTVYAAAWAIHALAFNPNLQCSQQKAEAPIMIGFIPQKRMYPTLSEQIEFT